MERNVKERLVGATLLVVIVVLVVPELLSGPKSSAVPKPQVAEPVRNITVDLATNRAMAPELAAPPSIKAPPTALVVSPAPLPASGAPSAGGSSSVAATESATPPPESLAPTPAHPVPAEKSVVGPAVESANPPAAAGVAASRWSVQLGSFASRSNANKLLGELKAKHFSGRLSVSGSGANRRYRVRIGPLASRSDAEQMALKLKAAGHGASIVPSG